jgi:predicted RNase H-like nuclease (RuvC/YqgF family)
MSEVEAKLKQENEQLNAKLKYFMAENDSCKQIINEGLQIQLNLRTNFGILNAANKDLSKRNSEFIQHVQNLLSKINDLEVKIADDERVIDQLRVAYSEIPVESPPPCDVAPVETDAA